MRFPVLLLAAFILAGPSAFAADRAALEACRITEDTQSTIAGCTRLIEDQSQPLEVRVFGLWSRAMAREDKDVKGAVADLDEALRLDPNSASAYSVRARIRNNAVMATAPWPI